MFAQNIVIDDFIAEKSLHADRLSLDFDLGGFHGRYFPNAIFPKLLFAFTFCLRPDSLQQDHLTQNWE